MHNYRAFGLNIASEITLPELSAGTESDPDVVIRIGDVDCPELTPTRIYRRGIQAQSANNGYNDIYLSWEGVAAFQAIDGISLIVQPFTTDPDLLSLFTVSEATGLILFQRSLLLLHASAVQVGGEAWCFLGEPGAGKSSSAAAFVKYGCPLLSDDLTAIHLDDHGKPFVIPAYPQLKIWDRTVSGLNYDQDKLQPVSEGVNKFSFVPEMPFPQNPVKLGRIFFLHNDPEKPEEGLLNAGEVSAEFVKHFPLPSELLHGDYLKDHFFRSLKCASEADMFVKKRPDGFPALEEWVKDSISKQTVHLIK